MKEKQVVQEAFTELAPRYEEVVDGELKTFWGWSYNKFVDQLVEQTPFKANQRILDIATGTSAIPRKILKNKTPGIHITGLDITESMLQQGKRKISTSDFNTSISLTCADAMKLPFEENSFDVIVSGLASHHLDIPLMLSEMERCLKPGGVLSIIDVGSSPFWEFLVTRGFIRLFAFIYFLFKESLTRARAEFSAVTNLRTAEGWQAELESAGYSSFEIRKLPLEIRWIPSPYKILAQKNDI